ncbi:hypothetical protein R0381_002337 [Jeongeupia wiesaeckerbachi]|uniref:hypothetical protein n=1 Tax=Jeongeupia wiesaeckerbachi TaxID=3051218 RepID=UPI003D802987
MKSFWKQLRNVQAGPNTLGQINLVGQYLQTELNDYASNRGIIRVKARPLAFGANGYALEQTLEYGPEVAEVFWLPWRNHEATVAARAEFEYSKRDIFFMTTTLSGCRFSVTPDVVIHVAHAAGYNSAGRTITEQNITGPRHALTRRVSVSAAAGPNDFQYGGALVGAYTRSLIFGARVNGNYTYKVLHTSPPPGNWEIIL